jgi:sodium transport system permease protein
MNARTVATIYRKELRETLRDRRTLVAVLLLPPLLYPLLALGSLGLAASRRAEYERLPTRVALAGEPLPELHDRLAAAAGLVLLDGTLARGDVDVELWAAPGAAAALAAYGSAALELRYDAALERSSFARTRVEEALDAIDAEVREARLVAGGLPPELVEPLRVEARNVAPPEKVGGSLLASIVPALLVMMMMVGAFYPAIDLTVGEKERGTLEVLLSAPVHPTEVVAGKFLAVATTAAASGAVNVASMAVTAAVLVAQARAAAPDLPLSFALAPGAAAALGVSLLLVALFFAALMMAVAAPARTLKEAQSYVTPVYLACLVPALLAAVGGFELTYGLAVVPLLGVALVVKALFLGALAPGPVALALVAAAGWAAGALWLAARAYTREQVLFGGAPPDDDGDAGAAALAAAPAPLRASWSAPGADGLPPRPGSAPAAPPAGGALPPRPALSLGEAFVLALVVVVLMLTAGALLQQTLGTTGFVLTEWVLLPLPVMVALRVLHVDVRAALSLRLPSARAVLGTVLVGATAWYPAMLAAALLAPFLHPDPEALKALEEAVRAPAQTWVTVAVFAVSPAVCEELLFRGALFSAFRRNMPGAAAVLVAAILFAAFHQPPFRMAPTFVLGLVFGYAVWRSGSLACGSLAHLMNNLLVVLVATLGPESAPATPTPADVAAAFAEPPVPPAVGAGLCVVLAAGLALLWSSRRAPRAGEASGDA